MAEEKINLARLKKEGTNFEIVVDPDLAISFRKEKKPDISDVLKSPEIFFDAKKGQLASTNMMKEIFGTDENEKIAEIILNEGDIQLSAEYREKIVEEKRKKVINIIHRNGVDPKTNLPHPMTRIENAFEEAKIKIDPNLSADKQVKDILKKLMVVLPIKFATKEIHVRIPSAYAAKAYSAVTKNAVIKSEDWLGDGSWSVTVEIPGGMEADFYDKLNSVCSGDFESKVISIR